MTRKKTTTREGKAEYMRKYMPKYRRFKTEQKKEAQNVLSRDDLAPAVQLDLLKFVLSDKPSIDVWGDKTRKKPNKRE